MAENRSRTSEDRRRNYPAAAFASGIAAAVLALAAASPALAQSGDSEGGPTYQRKGSFSGHGQNHHGDWRRREMPQFSSQTSASSFQRPYPYHLDYYRAKWGGSYAPYFGNLYGPPTYFINGSPWYGGFNGFNSFNSFSPGGIDNRFGGFGAPGFGGGPFRGGVPYGPWAGEYAAPAGEGEAFEGTMPPF